jgi:GT2 family glycosyltransferase
MNEKIAIIIANWNGLRFLRNCLQGVYSQTYQNFDVYFVDNGSTDDSARFVRENFPKTIILKLEKNTGFSSANNVGILEAFKDSSVRHIFTLNNDTEMDKDCLKSLVESISTRSDIASVAPRLKFLYDKNRINSVGILIGRDGGGMNMGYRDIDDVQYEKPFEIFGSSAGACLYRREALEDVRDKNEFFDNSFFAYYEDVDLAWRLRLRGWKSWYCPKALVFHVHSGTSTSYSSFKAYYSDRNRLFLIVKDLPLIYMVRAFLLTPYRYWKLLNAMLFAKKKTSHHPRRKTSVFSLILLTVKGWISLAVNLPFLISKRRRIQSGRKVSLADVSTWLKKYNASIDDMVSK